MRERLLQAAMELMKQRGLKFTVAELAARLGTSKRTIYEHFESKEQLIGVMVDEVIAELMEAEQEIYRDNRLTAAQKLRAILTLMPKGMQLSDNRLISDLMRFAPEEWRKVDRSASGGVGNRPEDY
ncbi:TetR/AcrR family transcriptional regulator [Paenibacillus sp. P25]|nr:TetR/AcrR family transcriptional regulator [Paenibacillus sp. P25]